MKEWFKRQFGYIGENLKTLNNAKNRWWFENEDGSYTLCETGKPQIVCKSIK